MTATLRAVFARLSLALAASVPLLLMGAGAVLAHGEEIAAPSFPGLLLEWTLDPLPFLGVVVAAVAYLWAERHTNAAHAGTRVPGYRRWLFLAGLAVVQAADAVGGVAGAHGAGGAL